MGWLCSTPCELVQPLTKSELMLGLENLSISRSLNN